MRSYHQISIQEEHILSTECKTAGGETRKTRLDLNKCIVNADGALQPGAG
jgi:hypothetical protein